MEIKPYTDDKAREVADVFHKSVHAIDTSLYSDEEKEAWAPTPPDYVQWAARLSEKKPFLAVVNERVVGFMNVQPDDHIDCAYIAPDFQRKGVAKKLYEHIEKIAAQQSIPRLYVEASKAAVSFFADRGFKIQRKNYVERSGIMLVNFTMEKHLG